MFELQSIYTPQGDQPKAIQGLLGSLKKNHAYQTLLGVTGSGKTFTVANLIQEIQKPTLIISHNKTLAAQLYSEFKAFFPKNAVEYFISYYDYYRPEAYLPQTDTYIEKDASINDDIERLRISAASSLTNRSDVIVIASVSCIYGLGSPSDFKNLSLPLRPGMTLERDALLEKLVGIAYERNSIEFTRGKFRVKGDVVDIFPAYTQDALRIEFFGDTLEALQSIDPLTGKVLKHLSHFVLYPANPYVTTPDSLKKAIVNIKQELEDRILELEGQNKLLEAQRLRMRTEYDLEMMQEVGYCSSIENYSRHLSGRKPGERPYCLMDFFPEDYFLVIDESHVTLPQIRAMYNGDYARKFKLVDFGFRLPSALDNRPLKFEEFLSIAPQALFVSATPGLFELERSSAIVEQLIRPTGLLDPVIEIRPARSQVEDLISEIHETLKQKTRVLVITLTKRMSEDIANFLKKEGINVEYLHSEIDAIERVEILKNLRSGKVDVLVGINLLREGLDLPEVSLVGILDADKEGFLRSETSLVQIAGRAARHEKGRVLLYADQITDSLKRFIHTTEYRRARQIAYNTEHHITPKTASRPVQESLIQKEDSLSKIKKAKKPASVLKETLKSLEKEMLEAAKALEFERAAVLRDQIDFLKKSKI